MQLRIKGLRNEVWPFVAATAVAFTVLAGLMVLIGLSTGSVAGGCTAAFAVLVAYFLYFFRDPERTAPVDDAAIVACADGTVACITALPDNPHVKGPCVRISIFLSLFDVHVNRAPFSGKSTFLGYFPGKHFFTFQEKSSDHNQHNEILFENDRIACLVTQIVGPVCRRVVYWPPHNRTVELKMGDRIGMMKFGSRLDMYLPADKVEVLTKPGMKVTAGVTLVARIKKD